MNDKKIISLMKDIEKIDNQQDATRALYWLDVLQSPVAIRYLIANKGADPSTNNWEILSHNFLPILQDISKQTAIECLTALIEFDQSKLPVRLSSLDIIIFLYDLDLFRIIYNNSDKVFSDHQVNFVRYNHHDMDNQIRNFLVGLNQFSFLAPKPSQQSQQSQIKPNKNGLYDYAISDDADNFFDLLHKKNFSQQELEDVFFRLIYSEYAQLKYVKTILNQLKQLPRIELKLIKNHDAELFQLLIENGLTLTDEDQNYILKHMANYDIEELTLLKDISTLPEDSFVVERELQHYNRPIYCSNKDTTLSYKQDIFIFEQKDSYYCFTRTEFGRLPRLENGFVFDNKVYKLPVTIHYGIIYKAEPTGRLDDQGREIYKIYI